MGNTGPAAENNETRKAPNYIYIYNKLTAVKLKANAKRNLRHEGQVLESYI